MSLSKKAAVLFAQNYQANPSGIIAQFGSLAAGTPNYTSDPAQIQGLTNFLNGWSAAVLAVSGGTTQPALEDRNALDFLWSYFLTYLQQEGIAEWDSTTVFTKGAFAKSTDGNGTLYVSQAANNQGNVLTNTTWWSPYLTGSTTGPYLCKAWGCFDGTNNGTYSPGDCPIYSSSNVASVYRQTVGQYLVNFTTPMNNANYAWSGSAGSPNGATPAQGDNNIICGGLPGVYPVKTTAQFLILCWQNTPNQLEDSSAISFVVFGT